MSLERQWFDFIAANEMGKISDRPDIVKHLDDLYRAGKIQMDHLMVLRHYGKRQIPPDKRRIKEVRAFNLWSEAFKLLNEKLNRPLLKVIK